MNVIQAIEDPNVFGNAFCDWRPFLAQWHSEAAE
jgi:hypothetical protein